LGISGSSCPSQYPTQLVKVQRWFAGLLVPSPYLAAIGEPSLSRHKPPVVQENVSLECIQKPQHRSSGIERKAVNAKCLQHRASYAELQICDLPSKAWKRKKSRPESHSWFMTYVSTLAWNLATRTHNSMGTNVSDSHYNNQNQFNYNQESSNWPILLHLGFLTLGGMTDFPAFLSSALLMADSTCIHQQRQHLVKSLRWLNLKKHKF
jgi:hypothetical protein